jgi:hypothetical protein
VLSDDATQEYAKNEGMVMAGSQESVVVYRRNAANCIEMAKEFLEPEARLVLLDMAQAWLKLADLAEKFADTLVSDQRI